MDKIARSDSLLSIMLVLNLVLILFMVENDLSLSVLVTAIVKAIWTSLNTV